MKMITEHLKFADVFPDKAASVAQRLHIKKDDVPFVRKYYTAEKDKSEVKKKERAVVSYISTGIKDRDGEKLVPEGVILENYQKNPIVPFGHDYKTIPPAKNMWIKRDEKGLIAKTVFAKNQRAEEYYQAYTEDIGGTGPLLNAFSVGFIPLEWEDTDTKALEKNPELPKRIYNKWELLEYSLVPIPSCAEALTIAVEKELFSKKLLKELEIEVVKDVPDREIEVAWVKDEEEVEIEIEKDEIQETPSDPELITLVEKAGKQIEGIEAEGGIIKDPERTFAFLRNENRHASVIITKPETTEDFHHIPIRSAGDFVSTSFRTIDISKPKGIKAVIGKLKSDPQGSTHIQKYLFDVNKFSMEEAKAWVEKNKPKFHERWNKSLSKLFDIASAESSMPLKFHYDLYEKFLECKIKDVFQNSYVIPSPLLGTYLAGFKQILGEFDLKDTRKFSWDGSEVPPDSEVIQLNSEKSDDFLINGMCFYEAEKKPLIVNFSPDFYGLTVTLTTSNENKEWNKEILDKVHSWAYENNFLRGEKFSLSGEFLYEPLDDWDNLILDEKYKDAIQKSANFLEKKGKKFTGRGLLFIGPPGTGKTKTGRVLMNELDATFIWVSSKDFRHVGPLRALALGFSLARDLAPSVLFLEDIDTWLRGEMEYVTDMIKTEMDGIKQNKGMITILTSNYPEKLPDALLDRPGRFHHIVNFELPNAKQRIEMLELWAGDIGEALFREIADKTEGFSGAHIKELVEFAKMIAEEDDIEIGKALIMSLDKLMEQRELIDEIRANKTDVKSAWSRIKLIEGKIQVSEETEALRSSVSKEVEVLKGVDREIQLGEEEKELFTPTEFRMAIQILKESNARLLQEKDDHIADLKAGRVLSRKNRNIVKDAITALNAVLKADATGTQEDEEVDETSDVTERTVELEKDGDTKTFVIKDIEFLVEKLVEKKVTGIIERSFEKQSDPEIIRKRVMEAVGIEIDKRKGRVR